MNIPSTPPETDNHTVAEALGQMRDLAAFWEEQQRGPAPDGSYRHWDTIRRMKSPSGLDPEEVWVARKLARRPLYRSLALFEDIGGDHFKYALVDPLLERLHRVYKDAAGQIALPELATNPATRDRYIVRSLIEEAIMSSQLEGAATTRAVAKEMIRTGRKPRDRSERMILNNYQAMRFVRTRLSEPLSSELVVDLHGIVTKDTLDTTQGAFRTPGDSIGVYDDKNQLLHSPPPSEEIDERLDRMCTFANESEPSAFLHPVIKSIILHFWLAYDHPFKDGNGRTARALFYWSMLKEGFWLTEYISISRILKQAPARYAKSFLYTETDENDLTYFLLAQLRVIERAIEDLQSYMQRKVQEVVEMKELLRTSSDLNHRQLALLSHASRNPGSEYTFESHGTSHDIAYATARSDLLGLGELGLLKKKKQGKRFVFIAVHDLIEKMRSMK